VAELDLSVLEDVDADAAAVHELSEDRPRGIALNPGAKLAQSHAPTAHFAYRELVPNQLIQVDELFSSKASNHKVCDGIRTRDRLPDDWPMARPPLNHLLSRLGSVKGSWRLDRAEPQLG
jgi:hypothetical protein